jgi:NAD(P)H-dependent nitrite reductase small subunit
MTVTPTSSTTCAEGATWVALCATDRVIPGRGVAARVGAAHVAVFVLPDGEVLAVDDVDPVSGASVLSRGLLGDVDGEPTVASPVYKQRFSLRSGRCLDDPTIGIATWPVRTRDGLIEVADP